MMPRGPSQRGWNRFKSMSRRIDAGIFREEFGIFIHWGLYAVPAFGNEWYPRNMYLRGTREFEHHVKTFGPQRQFGYKDFVPLFTAEHFDADEWAGLFRQAGAQFVVPVAEHHDGFAMYDCSFSDWTAVQMGPHRDTTGELAKAVRAAGLHFGLSSHRVEHNFFPGVAAQSNRVNDPQYAGSGPARVQLASALARSIANDYRLYSLRSPDDWLARGAELVEKYHPDVVFFDWSIGKLRSADLTRFAAYCSTVP